MIGPFSFTANFVSDVLVFTFCTTTVLRIRIPIQVHGAYIRYGFSEICAHVRSDLCYLISLRHWYRSGAVTNRFLSLQKRPIYLHTCAPCSELPCHARTTGLHEHYIFSKISEKTDDVQIREAAFFFSGPATKERVKGKVGR